jgi:NADP-dependent 3-hydroxy acid dehydrogenase YdfG
MIAQKSGHIINIGSIAGKEVYQTKRIIISNMQLMR